VILFPAIDLKDGYAVRLLRGEMGSATIFNKDPADQARRFAEAGFDWLHVVDLNGAFAGAPVNRAAVRSILDAVDLPVQLGGGIRSLAAIEGWLEVGINRIILGTAALKDPALVREACRRFPGRILVGIDARAGRVAVEGWAEQSEIEALELAKRFEDAGVAAIVFTDIDRDGVLQGPNLEATAHLAEQVSIPLIASGGVSSLDDIAACLGIAHLGIMGIIVGRALYDGRVDPASATALVRSADRAQPHPEDAKC
jgi:phosphoribosylformimino-5-aminoimidazole carboxamide ribotide isomerase